MIIELKVNTMKERVDKKLSVTIILDISGSMIEDGKYLLLDRTYRVLLDKLNFYENVETSISLFTFGDDIKMKYDHVPLVDLPDIDYNIGGQSDFSQITDFFAQNNSFFKKEETVLILTDGFFSDMEWEYKWKSIVEEYKLNVLTIQIGSYGEKTVFDKLSVGKGSHFFTPDNTVNLPYLPEFSANIEIEKYNKLTYRSQLKILEY